MNNKDTPITQEMPRNWGLFQDPGTKGSQILYCTIGTYNIVGPPYLRVLHPQIQPTADRVLCLPPEVG